MAAKSREETPKEGSGSKSYRNAKDDIAAHKTQEAAGAGLAILWSTH